MNFSFRKFIPYKGDVKCMALISKEKYEECAISVTTYEEENVNGYQLFDEKKRVLVGFEHFCSLAEAYMQNTDMDKEEFWEWYVGDDGVCSDWCKQDRQGNCYGGFWEYPEGSYERENAYTLSHEDSFEGLWELSYPKKMIITIVPLLCNIRTESVRDVNFYCEWVKRVVEKIFPLQPKGEKNEV